MSREDKMCGFLFILIIISIPLIIMKSCSDYEKRREYLNDHCKIIGSVSESTTVGAAIAADGSVSAVPVFIPGKTGYQCDDGLQYWE